MCLNARAPGAQASRHTPIHIYRYLGSCPTTIMVSYSGLPSLLRGASSDNREHRAGSSASHAASWQAPQSTHVPAHPSAIPGSETLQSHTLSSLPCAHAITSCTCHHLATRPPNQHAHCSLLSATSALFRTGSETAAERICATAALRHAPCKALPAPKPQQAREHGADPRTQLPALSEQTEWLPAKLRSYTSPSGIFACPAVAPATPMRQHTANP